MNRINHFIYKCLIIGVILLNSCESQQRFLEAEQVDIKELRKVRQHNFARNNSIYSNHYTLNKEDTLLMNSLLNYQKFIDSLFLHSLFESETYESMNELVESFGIPAYIKRNNMTIGDHVFYENYAFDKFYSTFSSAVQHNITNKVELFYDRRLKVSKYKESDSLLIGLNYFDKYSDFINTYRLGNIDYTSTGNKFYIQIPTDNLGDDSIKGQIKFRLKSGGYDSILYEIPYTVIE